MLKEFSDLIQIFGDKNAAKAFILKMGVRFYPILRAEGLGLWAPVGIVVEYEEMIESIVEVLRGFANPIMISLSERRKDFIKKVNDSEYELVPVLCKISSAHNRGNILYLNEIMVSGYVDKKVFSKVAVIFFIGGVPLEVADLLSGKIVFEGRRKGGEFGFQAEQTKGLLELFSDYWPCIQEKLSDTLKKDDRKNIFLTACKEISLILLNAEAKNPEEQRVVRMYKVYVNTIMNCWDIKSDYSDWIDKLRELILEEGKKFTAAEDRTKALDGSIAHTEEKLYYDKKYYYISEYVFAQACSHLSYYVGQCEMKNALAEAGILVGEGVNRKYFSVKLLISTPEGIRVIGRRMRIRREWMDRPGELTWVEQIELRRGKEE